MKAKRPSVADDDMRREYDFSKVPGDVRGKYHRAFRAGHRVKIHRADRTTIIQRFVSRRKSKC